MKNCEYPPYRKLIVSGRQGFCEVGDPTRDLEMPLITNCNHVSDDLALGSGGAITTCMWRIAAMYILIDLGANPN